ncbi:hypothetical protein K432DRAFT_441261 [Lepidopterella palustris CBS 459.81]|uniref:Transcription factor Iwr1 domain-containing protein n=1 Tax=Lepidopterella palustris CBS 459.81 TaxID=1314670 RepID=A0A8E2EF66_9PEZI|nr:hypothetical protein K432DRAFT_441261 [Lepidopterella palustris CBS 459.81]
MSGLSVKTLRIKRRRDEEAPDAVVIDASGTRDLKRRLTAGHGAFFRRVQLDEGISAPESETVGHQVPQRTASAQIPTNIPSVMVSLPREEDSLTHGTRPATEPPSPYSVSPTTTAPQSKSGSSTPRRFYLSRHTSSTQQITTGTGDKKRKRDLALPVFVEKRPHVEGSIHDLDNVHKKILAVNTPDPTRGTSDDVSALSPSPRKRPGASAAEKQWRAKNWNQPMPEHHNSIENVEQPSENIVSDLTKFAEEIDCQDTTPKKAYNSRFKPKAPSLRYRDRYPEKFAAEDHDAMDIDVEDESQYVYDTYVRDGTMKDPFVEEGSEPTGIFGYIVITDDDQTFWENQGEEDDSDKEFDTDDEDENAEDYYGADYPEDEVDSDDEYGVDAYKYRQGASDEEEYDVGNGAWSDDDELRYAWKKSTESREIGKAYDYDH